MQIFLLTRLVFRRGVIFPMTRLNFRRGVTFFTAQLRFMREADFLMTRLIFRRGVIFPMTQLIFRRGSFSSSWSLVLVSRALRVTTWTWAAILQMGSKCPAICKHPVPGGPSRTSPTIFLSANSSSSIFFTSSLASFEPWKETSSRDEDAG